MAENMGKWASGNRKIAKSGHRVAAEMVPFPRRWHGGMISANQEAIWGMSVRNVFAHARFHVDFKTPEIVDYTMKITVIENHLNPDFDAIHKGSTHPLHQIANSVRLHDPRLRYVGSCLYFAFALWELPTDPDDWDEDEDEDEGNT